MIDHKKKTDLVGREDSHVEDAVWVYSSESRFDNEVVKLLKEAFKCGAGKNYEVRYIELNRIQQEVEGFMIDFDHYV